MTISAGTIIPYGGSSAPSGFLLCDGSAVNRTTYSILFGVIGTTFGSGDGSTTFNVPDLRGRVPAGKDNMGGSAASRLTSTTMTPDGNTVGATGGEQTHTLVTSEMPSHTHVASPYKEIAGAAGGTTDKYNSDGNNEGGSPVANPLTGSTGGDGAHNNVQPTLIVNYIIATQDASGAGTVTSVGMTGDGVIFNSTVTGSPVTTSGTLAPSLLAQTANTVLAGPTSGGAATPNFRSLVGPDLPNPSSSTLGGVKAYAAVSHQWIDSIGTDGTPHSSQPAFSDLPGSVPVSQMAYPDYVSYTFFGGV
jgi:microcystin-dependent protein